MFLLDRITVKPLDIVMRYTLGILIMIWSLFSSAKDYSPVEVSNADGFVDLTFKIVEVRNDREYVVKGNLEGVKVGFTIELQESWNPQTIEDVEEPFYWGEAYFKSIGSDSKAFIGALAKLYGASINDFEVAERVHAQVVGLACNPSEVKERPCKTKFFFNSDGDEDFYSEVFINIDLATKALEFNEKDNQYRAPLLRSLLQ